MSWIKKMFNTKHSYDISKEPLHIKSFIENRKTIKFPNFTAYTTTYYSRDDPDKEIAQITYRPDTGYIRSFKIHDEKDRRRGLGQQIFFKSVEHIKEVGRHCDDPPGEIYVPAGHGHPFFMNVCHGIFNSRTTRSGHEYYFKI